ncbi:MAG: hypothetical protein WDZ37_03005 [Solirubrobacterales bacterium]
MSLFTPEPTPESEQTHHAPELERRFLRRGVKGMEAQREGCARCGRSLLVGERLSVFADRDGRERAVCDVCVSKVADGSLGERVRVQRVRAGERRLVIRAA